MLVLNIRKLYIYFFGYVFSVSTNNLVLYFQGRSYQICLVFRHILRYISFIYADNRQILGEMDGIDILLQQLAVSSNKDLYLSEKRSV